jgi:hypothetical protein
MCAKRCFPIAIALWIVCGSSSWAQAQKGAAPAAPPKLLLLVHQQTKFGKEGERRKLGVATTRACDRLNVPNSWIDLESITGAPEALFFDPLDSFEHLDKAFVVWGQLFAAHPELARMQEQVKALISSERTIIAVRRDDLGYRPQSIDFSKARFMRVLEVRLNPGHESDFVEAFKILGAAYEKINASTPWVVYQVNVGMPSPAFLVFVPMHALRQNDDLLAWRRDLREAEGEEAAHHMEQIARDAYDETESNLYAISPETSHVSKDFADGDPQFWSPKPPAAAKPLVRKKPDSAKKP